MRSCLNRLHYFICVHKLSVRSCVGRFYCCVCKFLTLNTLSLRVDSQSYMYTLPSTDPLANTSPYTNANGSKRPHYVREKKETGEKEEQEQEEQEEYIQK